MIRSMPSSDEIQKAYGHCPEPAQTARMFHAAWHNDPRSMLLAIERGASVDAVDPSRSSLAQICALSGSIELLRAAFDAGASACSPEGSERPSALASIARRSGVELSSFDPAACENLNAVAMAKLAYRHGAAVNAETSRHWLDHPLPQAASRDAVEMARFLLSRGAVADRVFHEGMTALLVACEAGAERVAHLLLDWSELGLSPDSKIDPSRKEQAGSRGGALHFAVASGCSAELIERLALAGAGVDDRDALSMTPLHLAANKGSLDAIAILVRLGADPNAAVASEFGRRPLFFAIDNGQVEACSLLLRLGADPEARDGDGRSFREAVAEDKNPEFVRALSSFDASRERDCIERSLSVQSPLSGALIARRPLSL